MFYVFKIFIYEKEDIYDTWWRPK